MFEIHLDPEQAGRQRELRDRRLHLVSIPALRGLGFLLVAAGILLHNRVFFDTWSWRAALTYLMAAELYTLLAWRLLHALYDRVDGARLSLLLLVADFVPWGAAIVLTGGTASWIFFLPLARVLDQAGTGSLRTLVFAHLAPLTYVLVLVYLAASGEPIEWDQELAKTIFLYILALYATLTGRTTETLRSQTAEAVRMARELIGRLRDQSAELRAKTVELEEKSDRLAITSELAERASKAKTELMTRAGRELRPPLARTLAFAEMLIESELGSVESAAARGVIGNTRHVLAMLDQLLDISDVELRELALTVEAVDIVEVMADVLASAEPFALARHVSLDWEERAPCTEVVRADRRRLRQVLMALVLNAVLYNRPEGTVRVGCAPAWGGRYRIRVTDTGPGIPQEKLERLFVPFDRLDVESSGIAGAGLGLPIARAFVIGMDGELGVESRDGHGSTFWVELPLAGEEPPPESSPPDEPPPAA